MKTTRLLYSKTAQPQWGFPARKIFYVVPDDKWESFAHTTNFPLDVFEITEVDETGAVKNLDLRNDLIKYVNTSLFHVDTNGDEKYIMVDNAGTWELQEVENWVEVDNGL